MPMPDISQKMCLADDTVHLIFDTPVVEAKRGMLPYMIWPLK